MDKLKNDGEGEAGSLDYLLFIEDELIEAETIIEEYNPTEDLA